jgi:hypothetical protein
MQEKAEFLLLGCLAFFSALKMEAIHSFNTSVNLYRTAWLHILQLLALKNLDCARILTLRAFFPFENISKALKHLKAVRYTSQIHCFTYHCAQLCSLSSISIPTYYGLDCLGYVPGMARFFSIPQSPHHLLDPPSLLYHGYRLCFLGGKVAGA